MNVNKSNIPPLIPASTNYTTNYSNFLQTEEVVVSDQLTDGVAILSGGTLTNLVNGSDPQDAVNKAYISGTSFPSVTSSIIIGSVLELPQEVKKSKKRTKTWGCVFIKEVLIWTVS